MQLKLYKSSDNARPTELCLKNDASGVTFLSLYETDEPKLYELCSGFIELNEYKEIGCNANELLQALCKEINRRIEDGTI